MQNEFFRSLFSRALDFYISSSGGSLNHAWIGNVEPEGCDELALLGHFFPKQGDQVQAGRAASFSSPFR
jgi:hypothetical protein